MNSKLKWILLMFVGIVAVAVGMTKDDSKELVVYSARNEQLIRPLFEAYEKETGTKITFFTDKAAPLIQKLLAEKDKTPADILFTVDAGNLYFATLKGIFTPLKSETLEENIPQHLRDPKGHWFGLTVRARSMFYNKEKVQPETLSTYEDLASKKWKGRLCLRTSKKVYNKSLVATMYSHLGEKETERVIKGWVTNLATPVFSSDSKMLEAIAAGQCDVGIANTYYYGRLLRKNPKMPVGIFWPNQNSYGAHVNVSGAGVIKYSKNKESAKKFLEWLSGKEAQKIFVNANLEYPVNGAVKPNALVKSFGLFKQDKVNLMKAGEFQATAVKIMDRAGYK